MDEETKEEVVSTPEQPEQPAEAAEPIDSEPVTYTPAGEIAATPVETEPTVSVTA